MQITDAAKALKFIYGGKAIFTLVSKVTGKRYTYRTRLGGDGGPLIFADLLTGPDNSSDYMYLGHFWARGSKGLMAGGKGNPSHPAFAALDWTLLMLHGNHMPSTLEFWHEGRCARCGRRLTTPESIESGFGPECVKKGVAV